MESFLCRCCAEQCDLTRRELQYFYRFRDEMGGAYDETNAEHEVRQVPQ